MSKMKHEYGVTAIAKQEYSPRQSQRGSNVLPGARGKVAMSSAKPDEGAAHTPMQEGGGGTHRKAKGTSDVFSRARRQSDNLNRAMRQMDVLSGAKGGAMSSAEKEGGATSQVETWSGSHGKSVICSGVFCETEGQRCKERE